MRSTWHRLAALTLSFVIVVIAAVDVFADAVPIAGTVKSVDGSAGSFVVQAMTKGQPRDVVIHMRPDSRIVRFVRSTDGSKPGFSEQPATLTDLKAGWTVSVSTRHEAASEVADVVRVVHEK